MPIPRISIEVLYIDLNTVSSVVFINCLFLRTLSPDDPALPKATIPTSIAAEPKLQVI